MIAGQRSIGNNNKENFLFPLEYMYISQDEGGSYSHEGRLSIDFLGYGPNGRIYRCPYYAPCSCHCVYVYRQNAVVVWQSDNEVNRIDGSVGYVTFCCIHDNDHASFNVGDRRTQGDLLGHTGTAGQATGDHLHFNTSNGTYSGWADTGDLKNSTHIYNTSGVNNTILRRPLVHNWRTYSGKPPIPPRPPVEWHPRKGFKFYLYKNRNI